MRIQVSREEAELLYTATRLWGEAFQENMVIEECSELITAIRHFNRGKLSHEELVTEVVDVLIVCTQLAINLDPIYAEDEMERRLERLRERVETNNHAEA